MHRRLYVIAVRLMQSEISKGVRKFEDQVNARLEELDKEHNSIACTYTCDGRTMCAFLLGVGEKHAESEDTDNRPGKA